MSHPNKRHVQAGEQFGPWTIVREAAPRWTPNGTKRRVMVARCVCGVVKTVRLSFLVSGCSPKCGHPKNRCDCGKKCRGYVCIRCRKMERHIHPRPTRKRCLAAGPSCAGRMQADGYCRLHSQRVQQIGTVDGHEDYPSIKEGERLRQICPSLFPGQRFGPMTGARALVNR
jgi:hypothetical protein